MLTPLMISVNLLIQEDFAFELYLVLKKCEIEMWKIVLKNEK